MRGPGAAVATIIVMLAVAAGAFALPRDAELGRIDATGPVTLSSSAPGVALLHGDALLPGDSVTGLITLRNTGDKTGRLALTFGALRDTPGPYGGRLSSVLRVRLDDLTGGGKPVETTLARTSPVGLADLRGREARTYKVTATFPDTGVPSGPGLGDNAQQGSRVEVAMAWSLTEREPAAPTPPARPAGGQGSVPAPGPAPILDDVRPPKLLTLRVPRQRVHKKRKLKVYASCAIKCKLRFSVTLDNAPKRGAKAKRRKVLMGKKVIRQPKRWLKITRVGKERRFSLKLTKKARRTLRRQLKRRGRVGITVRVRMRSVAGNRYGKRRIVVRTAKRRTSRRSPAPR